MLVDESLRPCRYTYCCRALLTPIPTRPKEAGTVDATSTMRLLLHAATLPHANVDESYVRESHQTAAQAVSRKLISAREVITSPAEQEIAPAAHGQGALHIISNHIGNRIGMRIRSKISIAVGVSIDNSFSTRSSVCLPSSARIATR